MGNTPYRLAMYSDEEFGRKVERIAEKQNKSVSEFLRNATKYYIKNKVSAEAQ